MAKSALRDISPTWYKDIKAPPEQKPFGQAVSDILGGVALAAAPIPVVGDVAGLASDAAMYAAYPEERTMMNAGMSLAGLLPLIPGAAIAKTANRVSPKVVEYASSAGFDPRIIQTGAGANIGAPRVADLDRLQALQIETGANRLPEIPAFNIEAYEGYPIMVSMADRAAAGDVLMNVNQVPVNVNRRGGQDFMFDPLNTGKVWASDKSVVLGSGESRMLQMAKNLKQKTGRDPLFAPWTMAPTGVDYSTMTGETMLRYAQNNMNKTTMRSLNKDIKAIIPEWNGMDDPMSIERFYSASGDDRKSIIQLMDKKYRDRGSLTSGEARLAVTDRSQYLNPDGTLRNVGMINPDAPAFVDDVHPTYNTALAGMGVGRFQAPVQVYELFPQTAMLGGFDPMNPPRNALRSLEMKPWSAIITEDLIKGIQARRQ